jgi:DNA replication protein DnaC
LEDALHVTKFFFKEFKKENTIQNTRSGLLFMGGVGAGKTRLVCTMIRAFTLEYGIPCLFQEFSSLLSDIKSGYDKGLSESVVLEKINAVEILVIDELGKGRKSDWEINILDTIISNRYNMQKSTLFTTNYTDKVKTTYQDISTTGNNQKDEGKRETLEQRVYSRIYSRLKGMCNFVEMQADDFRHPEAEIALRQR